MTQRLNSTAEQALGEALAKRPHLVHLSLQGNLLGAHGCPHLCMALGARALAEGLRSLSLAGLGLRAPGGCVPCEFL